jgi:hypothetical protein
MGQDVQTESETDAAERGDRLVEIFVNDPSKPVLVPREVTGFAIKQAAGVDPTFDLYRVRGEHEDPVNDDETITVHKGERFIATPKLDPS